MAEQTVSEVASPSTSPSEAARPPAAVAFYSADPEGDYTMLDKIGTGSFGTVWKALHRHTNTVVAVKKVCIILHTDSQPSFTSSFVIFGQIPVDDNVDDVMKEARAMRVLQHKNIVAFYASYVFVTPHHTLSF